MKRLGCLVPVAALCLCACARASNWSIAAEYDYAAKSSAIGVIGKVGELKQVLGKPWSLDVLQFVGYDSKNGAMVSVTGLGHSFSLAQNTYGTFGVGASVSAGSKPHGLLLAGVSVTY